MKRTQKVLVSSLLVICMFFMSTFSVFAYSKEESIEKDDGFFSNFALNDPSIEVLEYMDKGHGNMDMQIKYSNGISAKIKEEIIDNKIHLKVIEGTLKNELLIDLETDDIFLDGNKITFTTIYSDLMSIESTNHPIVPLSSRIYSRTPVYGSASDYTKYYTTIYHNINLETAIKNVSLSALTGLFLFKLFGKKSLPGSLISTGIVILYEATLAMNPLTKKTYSKETQYCHKSMSTLYKKHNIKYYNTSSYTNPTSSSIVYSGWAGL